MQPGIWRSIFGSSLVFLMSGCGRELPQNEQPAAPQELAQEASAAPAAATPGQEQSFEVALSSSTGKPNPGDEDGRGTAHVTLNSSTGEVCYHITVANIDTPTAAHIHTGTADTAGGVAVPFDAPGQGEWQGCVAADAALVRKILANPAGHYINVHNKEFPGGAIRGQLQTAD